MPKKTIFLNITARHKETNKETNTFQQVFLMNTFLANLNIILA